MERKILYFLQIYYLNLYFLMLCSITLFIFQTKLLQQHMKQYEIEHVNILQHTSHTNAVKIH